MLLDIGFNQYDNLNDRPLPTTPKEPGEAFDLSLDAFRRTSVSDAERAGLFEWYEQASEALYKSTGQRFVNPLSIDAKPPVTPKLLGRQATDDQPMSLRDQARLNFDDALRKARETGADVPDPDMADESVQLRAREALRASRGAEAVDTGLSAAAGFAGDVVGSLSDPITLATLPLGGSARFSGGMALRILKTALTEGAIAGGTQIPIEAVLADFRTRANLDIDSASNVLAAVAGGMALGGVGRAGVEGLERLLGRRATLAEKDAAMALDRSLADSEGSPLGRANLETHQMALDIAERQVAQGRAVVFDDLPSARVDDTAATPGARVFTASGRSIDTEFQVVEAASLIASHKTDLSPNPLFPGDLQPRDRARAASEAQIAEISGGLQPERLGASPDASTGAPIVAPDDLVESGNGRVLALRRVYEQNRDAATRYREFVTSQGFKLDGFKEPVLIRRRTTPMSAEERIAFARESNASAALGMAASERALVDARMVGPVLALHRGGDIASPTNRDFVRAFAKGLPDTERANLMDADGALSTEGRRRLEGALLARAYGDEAPELMRKLLEADDNDIKAIGGALADSSARWARMRAAVAAGDVAPGMDVTADLVAAVHMVEHSRAARTKVADLMAQGEMFGNGMTDTARALLASFFREPGYQRPASRKAIAERLDGYLAEAEKTRPGDDMFGASAPSAGDVLNATDPKAQQRSLFVADARESAKVFEAPETAEAALQEARRIAAGPDPLVMIDDQGRKASDLLADLEDRKAIAKEIANSCVFGRAAE